MRENVKKYFELIMIAPFILIWIFMVSVFKMPVITFGENGFMAGFVGYAFPILYATAAQAIILFVLKVSGKNSRGLSIKETALSALYIPFVCVVFFLHFNFKSWMPLVNHGSFDVVYNRIDDITGIYTLFSGIGVFLNHYIPVSALYSELFFAMFMLSFVAHAALDNFDNFRKMATGTCMILLLGGVSYWIAPAVGPFIFGPPRIDGFYENQSWMYQAYSALKNTGVVMPGYFGSAPAAMPSLHVANSLFFLLRAKKSLPVLLPVYVPFFAFIVIVAVASKWHYAIDLVVGALLAFFVDWAVEKLL